MNNQTRHEIWAWIHKRTWRVIDQPRLCAYNVFVMGTRIGGARDLDRAIQQANRYAKALPRVAHVTVIERDTDKTVYYANRNAATGQAS